MRCSCPIYCRYCGRRRSRDSAGHYCKTDNCQWKLGYSTCTIKPKRRIPTGAQKLARARAVLAQNRKPKRRITQ